MVKLGDRIDVPDGDLLSVEEEVLGRQCIKQTKTFINKKRLANGNRWYGWLMKSMRFSRTSC